MTDTPKPLRLVCVSDTHGQHWGFDSMPAGDVLLVAGDFTERGKRQEIEDFDFWLSRQPYRFKVVVSGNHDLRFEEFPEESRQLLSHANYLRDSEVNLRPSMFGRDNESWKVRIWGAPWTPRFYDWAFNLDRGSEKLRKVWQQVPTGVDVLVTHGPPFGILDRDPRADRVGCELLRAELDRIRPRVHVFGHLHRDYGIKSLPELPGSLFVNAAICDDRYEVHRNPIVIDLGVGECRNVEPV